MPKKNSPGGCTCCACLMFSDTFASENLDKYTPQGSSLWWVDYDTIPLGGGSSYRDYYATTNDANAILTRDFVGSLGASYRIRTQVRAAADGDQGGIVFDYVDDQNYYYALLTIAAGTGYCGNVSLHRVVLGVDSELFSYDMYDLRVDEWHTLEVCVRGEAFYYPTTDTQIRVHVTSRYNWARQFRHDVSDSLDSEAVGLITGTNAGGVDFGSLYIWTHEDIDPACPPCNHWCAIAAYGSGYGGFTTANHQCEWTGTGTVSGGDLILTGDMTDGVQIPNPEGAGPCVVRTAVRPGSSSQTVRVSASGCYGEIVWDVFAPGTADGYIRVNNGSETREIAVAIVWSLPSWVHLILSIETDRISFGYNLTGGTDYVCVTIFGAPTTVGATASIRSIAGVGVTVTVDRFEFDKRADEVTLLSCYDHTCFYDCDVCDDTTMSPAYSVEVPDLGWPWAGCDGTFVLGRMPGSCSMRCYTNDGDSCGCWSYVQINFRRSDPTHIQVYVTLVQSLPPTIYVWTFLAEIEVADEFSTIDCTALNALELPFYSRSHAVGPNAGSIWASSIN